MINVLHILFLYSYIQLFKRPNVVFMIHKLIMDLLINIFQKKQFYKSLLNSNLSLLVAALILQVRFYNLNFLNRKYMQQLHETEIKTYSTI